MHWLELVAIFRKIVCLKDHHLYYHTPIFGRYLAYFYLNFHVVSACLLPCKQSSVIVLTQSMLHQNGLYGQSSGSAMRLDTKLQRAQHSFICFIWIEKVLHQRLSCRHWSTSPPPTKGTLPSGQHIVAVTPRGNESQTTFWRVTYLGRQGLHRGLSFRHCSPQILETFLVAKESWTTFWRGNPLLKEYTFQVSF